jgi:hypothetical protein
MLWLIKMLTQINTVCTCFVHESMKRLNSKVGQFIKIAETFSTILSITQ